MNHTTPLSNTKNKYAEMYYYLEENDELELLWAWIGRTFRFRSKVFDIQSMPRYAAVVKNGADSVSTGKAYWTEKNLVTCREHGAMLCVSEDRKLWRCPACNEGAYMPVPSYR